MSSDFAAQTERERALFEMVRCYRRCAITLLETCGTKQPSLFVDSRAMYRVPGPLLHGVINYCEWQDLQEKSHGQGVVEKSSDATHEPAGSVQSLAGEASANRTQEGSQKI